MAPVSSTFLFDVISIILIDVLLAGDNAVVIAMAVKSLPPAQRRIGIAVERVAPSSSASASLSSRPSFCNSAISN